MFKQSLLALALSAAAIGAQAHQLWLERDADGPARVYVGDADSAHDSGEEVAKLAATTQVFTTDRAQPAKLVVKPDHLEVAVAGTDDVRLVNDQVWKPWKTKEGHTKAAVFNARAGRTDTHAVLDYELVPVKAGGDTFTLFFRGQPVADKAVTVINPEKWSKHFKTDKAGRIDVPVKEKGRYILVSAHDADAVGELEIAGQKVQKLGYTATLSFVAR
jgi:hypothetical protein